MGFAKHTPSTLLAVAISLSLSLVGCGGAASSSGGGGGTGGGNLACNGMALGQTASLNGFVPFTGSSLWNTDISTAPVDPNSATIMGNWVG